jgi:DNA repair protein RadC
MKTHSTPTNDSDLLIANALRCLEERLSYQPDAVLRAHSRNARAYLRLQLAEETNEVFAVLFLNNQNRLLVFEKLFYGTINQAVVYPRVVVQKALSYNAAKVMLAHNHPSNDGTPSADDKEITDMIQRALGTIHISVIDHIIVSHQSSYSFVENGLLPCV